MNVRQKLWWEQSLSDLDIWILLRKNEAPVCHQLHYLQMATEKLGKAYFWRGEKPEKKSHACFVRFLRRLSNCRNSDRQSISEAFGFHRFTDFESWLTIVLPIARELERLSPDLAGEDGPNPEYPWPYAEPVHAPVNFEFPLYSELAFSGRGRQFLQAIERAVRQFALYA